MSHYQDAMNLLDTSKYVKLVPGVKPRLRLLDHPWVSTRQYQTGGDIKTVFSWLVWDYTAQRVRILEKGKSIMEQIEAIMDLYSDAMPAEYDIVISTTGSGLETKYRVDGLPKQGAGIPDPTKLRELMRQVDMAKETGGIPIAQVAPDNMPQLTNVSTKGSDGSASAGPSEPEAEDGTISDSGDVILSPEEASKINLDDIPY